MLDYWKLWINDKTQIDTVLSNTRIRKYFTNDEDGVLTGIKGRFENWKVQTLNFPFRLEISGSIHKYWNKGSNENDFSFHDAINAIGQFCQEFELNPTLARVVNLEFGVNLQLAIDASEMMLQFVNYKGHDAIQPYRNTPDCFFMEYKPKEYYLKVYDKGKQYRPEKPATPNTLRIEVKAMKNRLLKGVTTLADLQQPEKLQVLGVKFATLVKGLVLADDSINTKALAIKERQLFRQMDSIKFWKAAKRRRNTTLRKKITTFKKLVEKYGQRKVYSTLYGAIEQKLQHLSGSADVSFSTANTYRVKTDTIRLCRSCGRDISFQHRNSRFCSAKYVGERAAKKCRNSDSNPRNNRKRKIARITSKGVLFDVEPYIIDRPTKQHINEAKVFSQSIRTFRGNSSKRRIA